MVECNRTPPVGAIVKAYEVRSGGTFPLFLARVLHATGRHLTLSVVRTLDGDTPGWNHYVGQQLTWNMDVHWTPTYWLRNEDGSSATGEIG